MEIQVASLCDAAVDYAGKLSMLGAFDTLVAKELPATHAQCAVVLRILFRKEEEGTHSLHVNFVNEDGRSIIPPIEGEIQVNSMGDFFFTSHNMVLNLQQLRFESTGLYSVDVTIDGRQVASISLQILKRE